MIVMRTRGDPEAAGPRALYQRGDIAPAKWAPARGSRGRYRAADKGRNARLLPLAAVNNPTEYRGSYPAPATKLINFCEMRAVSFFGLVCMTSVDNPRRAPGSTQRSC